MFHLRASRYTGLIIFAFICSIAVTAACLRLHDINYAAAVSDLDYRLCQESDSASAIGACGVDAKQAYDLMDRGYVAAIMPAVSGIVLLWIVSGIAVVIVVVGARILRKLCVGYSSH